MATNKPAGKRGVPYGEGSDRENSERYEFPMFYRQQD
jgi:hypothetical protein